MNNKRFSSVGLREEWRAFRGRNWIVAWMVFTLVLFPGFPGGNVISLPFAHLLQAGGDGYEGGYEDTGAVSETGGSEYDYYSEDSDGDGFSDEAESQAGTDPYDENSYPDAVDPAEVDTDGDGLTDSEEESGFEINHDVWVEDSTGYYNVEEDSIGFWMQITETVMTDPEKPDTDGDGLPDGWEVNSGFNPISRADGLADGDLDGLSVGQEYQLGTNWLDPDTDGDGLLDGDEVLLFESDPNDPSDPGPETEPETESESVPPSGGMAGQDSGSGGSGGSGGTLEQETKTDSAQESGVVPVTDSGSGGEEDPTLPLPQGNSNNRQEDSKYTYEVKGVGFYFGRENRPERGEGLPPTQGVSSEIINKDGEVVDVIEGDPETFESLEEGTTEVVTPEMGWVAFYDGSNYQPFDSYESAYEEYSFRRQVLPIGNTAALPMTNGFGTWVEWDNRNVLEARSAVFRNEEDVVTIAYAGGRIVRVKVAKVSKQDEEKTFLLVKQRKKTGWYDNGSSQPITEYPWVVMSTEVVKLKIRAGETVSERGAMLVADVGEGYINKTSLLSVEMVPDYNRDGRINDEDRGKVTKDEPWRWWVNDDDDSGEFDVSGADTPKQTQVGTHITGMRDLVDLFPLYLNLAQTLEIFPASEYKYIFIGNKKYVETDLKPENAGDFLRRLNSSEAGSIDSADALEFAQFVVQRPLSEGFLNKIKNEDKGVVLVNAITTTSDPFKIRILKDGNTVAEIEFPVKISNVDEMFRHIDLRMVPRNRDGSVTGAELSSLTTHVNDPGAPYPDSLTNGKYFVFIHGFNVNESKARGWQAEIFKRMHQMGSRARFVGISWYGDTGIGQFQGTSNNTNYHRGVFNAFQTGDVLKDALNFTGGNITIAAHSLGNIVVSHAISEGGFSPDRYYMINAAAAMEAYDSSGVLDTEKYRMTERSWKPYLATIGVGHKVTASRWYELFDDSDERSRLKWKDRFSKATDFFNLYNFYSPGDDVVQDAQTDTANLIDNDWNTSRGSWGVQELVKGTTWVVSMTQEPRQAGWGFHSRYYVIGQRAAVIIPPSSSTVSGYSDSYLRDTPIFRAFLEPDLTNPTLGSDLAKSKLVRYHVLAGGIPALSFAAATHELGTVKGNFNMPELFQTDEEQWPKEGHEDSEDLGQWIHSDFYGVALSHVYKMYEKMIELGKLDDENEE